MTRWCVVVTVLAGCGRVAFDPLASMDAAGGDTAEGVACGAESSLVACWSFENDLLDRSASANHGTGTTTYSTGHRGLAASFGAGTDVRIADSPSLDFRVVTIMGWVRVDVLGADPRSLIFDRNNGLALFVRNTTGSAGIGVRTTSTSGGPNDPAAFPLGTWTHLAGTYDGTLITLYVGGALVASLPMTGDITSDDLAGSRIGGNLPDTTNNAEEVLQGQIDELGVWNEALPAGRIIAAAAQ